MSWFWIGKYFNQELNSFLNHFPSSKLRAIIGDRKITITNIDEETTAKLIKFNLIEKHDEIYKPVFAFFKNDEFIRFEKFFETDRQNIAVIVEKLVLFVYESFRLHVPERLHSQITGILGGYLHSLVGFIVNELQSRGVLAPISENGILTANIMYVNKNA